MSSENGVMWFFFQAEDGIRDLTVTGVQTCALPISAHLEQPRRFWTQWLEFERRGFQFDRGQRDHFGGEECASRWRDAHAAGHASTSWQGGRVETRCREQAGSQIQGEAVAGQS